MVSIGSSVLINGSILYGVVLGYSETRYGMYKVRVWDPMTNRYRTVEKSPLSLTNVTNPLLFSLVNRDDHRTPEIYKEIAISLAIDTHDKEWFESFGSADRKPT